jgi:hypothetical protein
MIDLLRKLLQRADRPERPSTEAPASADAYKVAFDEAVRAIEGQRSSVDELRSRAGILLSAASLVAGFLGPAALSSHAPAWILVAATVVLLVAAGLVVYVLMPSDHWVFSLSIREMLQFYVEGPPPATMAEIYRSLAWYLDDAWNSNKDELIKLYRVFSVAAFVVAVDVVFWLAAITMRGA